MRVLLADDEADVRSALRLVVEQGGGTVAGECEVFAELKRSVWEREPGLLLLDWELPGWADLCGHRKRRTILGFKHEYPGLRVVALSGRPEARLEALAAGADAFASKAHPSELLDILAEHIER